MRKVMVNLEHSFGSLTVLRESGKEVGGHRTYECGCTCGGSITMRPSEILSGKYGACYKCMKKQTWAAQGLAGLRKLYCEYRASARDRGLEFSLSTEELKSIADEACVYCGCPPKQVSRLKMKESRGDNAAHGEYVHSGIDRIDSSRGYTVDNCVPCCKTCNFAKNIMSVDEFLSWIKRVYEHNFSTKVSSDSTDKNSGGAE